MQTEGLFNTSMYTLAEAKCETLHYRLDNVEAVALLNTLHDTLA